MKRISKNQILVMYEQLIKETGGTEGIRDESLLESALNAPFQLFDGEELFPTIQQKAARLGYGIIMNHPFVDGNKRIGTHTMLVFLALNGIELEYSQKELYSIILDLSAENCGLPELVDWIIKHQN